MGAGAWAAEVGVLDGREGGGIIFINVATIDLLHRCASFGGLCMWVTFKRLCSNITMNPHVCDLVDTA